MAAPRSGIRLEIFGQPHECYSEFWLEYVLHALKPLRSEPEWRAERTRALRRFRRSMRRQMQ